MKIRSFLAFDIPPKVKKNLGKLIHDFSKKETGVKWLDAEGLHVTMKFFGDVEESLLLGDISHTIANVVSEESPVTLDCAGLGVFPNWRYPKIIWAGFIGDSDPILEMQKKLEGALEKFHLKKDERTFRLHLTIGRAKGLKSGGNLMHLINELGPINFGAVTIDRLILYKSVLTKDGSVYTPLRNFNLTK